MKSFDESLIEEILESHPLLVVKSYSHLQKIENEKVVWNKDKVVNFINTNPDAKYSLINLIRNNLQTL